MKTAIIANPKAGHGEVGRRWREYNRAVASAFGPAEVRMTLAPKDATHLARRFVREGFERLIVVGGDGTLSEVVQGLFAEDRTTYLRDDLMLVPLPAGTGQDFCRSVGFARGFAEGLREKGRERMIDVGHARFVAADGRLTDRHFLNMASFGASGEIVRRVHAKQGLNAGRVPFLWQTLSTLYRFAPSYVRLIIDDHFDEAVHINTVAVANGRYFGGAMKVAPDAALDDGKFDVVIMNDIRLQKFLRYSLRLYRGRHIGLPEIRVVRGRHVRAIALRPGQDVLLDLDGEQPGRLPLDVKLLPKRLRLFAPWKQTDGPETGSLFDEGRGR